MAAYLVGVAPPLWVNRKPNSTNLRKGCTAVVEALRLELFVVLVGMQVNESHPLTSEMLMPPLEIGAFYFRNRYKEIPLDNFLIFKK